MSFGSMLLGRRGRRTGLGRLAMERWGGLYGFGASVLVLAAYRYIQRRRSRSKTLPGYVGTKEYAAPVAH